MHIASSCISALLMKHAESKQVQDLRSVAAALSTTDGRQAAHGVLHEEEAHRDFFVHPENKTRVLTPLGHRDPSALSKVRKTKQFIAKKDINLKFSRNNVAHFPGKSLENAVHGLAGVDSVLDICFHPLALNFPTHNSFIFCKGSELFDVDKEMVKADKVAETEASLGQRVVLVGLQMTVSKSDTTDKPSHTVVGEYLKAHLDGAMRIAKKIHPGLDVPPDVVTAFLSPAASCRKAKFMPVLQKNGKEMGQAISLFGGVAPQCCTIHEVPLIQALMAPNTLKSDRD